MEANQYKGKNILAWLFFNESYEDTYGEKNKVCYVYPRVVLKEPDYDPIDQDDFPQVGRIEVRIQGGKSAEEIYNQFGPLVIIRINGDLTPNFQGNNWYSLKYNPQYGKTRSEIWIDHFSSGGFYQVIDINSNIDKITKEKSIPVPECRIYTTRLLLRYKNKLYGPFEYDTKEGLTTLQGLKEFQYIIGEYEAIDYNDNLLIVEDQNDEEAVILLPKSVISTPENCKIHYDWISENVLIDSFIDLFRAETTYSRTEVNKFKNIAHRLIDGGLGTQFTDERMSKIKELLQRLAQKDECAGTLVEYALEDEHTANILAVKVANDYYEKIQSKIEAISSVREKIERLKAEEASLNKKIEILKNDQKEKLIIKEVSSENQAKIGQLENELQKVNNENKNLRQKLTINKEIADLKAEKGQLEKERENLKANYDRQLLDNKKLEEQFNHTLESFNDRAKQTARIIDSKLLDKILRGVDEDATEKEIEPFDTSLLCKKHLNYTDIINRVTKFVQEAAHRDIAVNDITNYLICITQGFITTFAGEPGTGKTSLCNILAKSLGLVVEDDLDPNTSQKRFIDVAVERGWSSHKDFIGYYNPLAKKMERSNGEVFSAFERMDKECNCKLSNIAPFIILLDEANLSPIEHYWAAFLKICDFASSANRSISLGGTRLFKIPEHLRFLATVNFDHTTEELSPRFLDRSWVIMLEPSQIDEEADEIDEYLKNMEGMISFQDLKDAFGVNKNDTIDEVIQNKWDLIQKIFRDHALPITPRNLKMVRNYCAVGCRCMMRDTPSTKLAPLDYAVAQKILPIINGTGENYRRLLEDLQKECTMQNMPISAKHLERIQRIADNNMGFFQFFAR